MHAGAPRPRSTSVVGEQQKSSRQLQGAMLVHPLGPLTDCATWMCSTQRCGDVNGPQGTDGLPVIRPACAASPGAPPKDACHRWPTEVQAQPSKITSQRSSPKPGQRADDTSWPEPSLHDQHHSEGAAAYPCRCPIITTEVDQPALQNGHTAAPRNHVHQRRDTASSVERAGRRLLAS